MAWRKESCSADQSSRRWSHDENQTHSPFGIRGADIGASTGPILVRSPQSGQVCAGPPDWTNHPQLRTIPEYDRRAFRQAKITEWLGCHVEREGNERFCDYIVRCVAVAVQELKMQRKMHIGDDFLQHLDKLVFKLFYGARIAQTRRGMRWSVDTEELVLQLLREECAYLVSNGMLQLDPSKLNSPTTPAWPNPDDVALHSAQRIPRNLESFVGMDSR